jgi:hypothetical protein
MTAAATSRRALFTKSPFSFKGYGGRTTSLPESVHALNPSPCHYTGKPEDQYGAPCVPGVGFPHAPPSSCSPRRTIAQQLADVKNYVRGPCAFQGSLGKNTAMATLGPESDQRLSPYRLWLLLPGQLHPAFSLNPFCSPNHLANRPSTCGFLVSLQSSLSHA